MTDKSDEIIKKLNSLEKGVAKIEKILNNFFGKFEKQVIDLGENDPLLPEAVKMIQEYDQISASFLQRRLSIGYARAVSLLDHLEVHGYVRQAEGSLPRKVLKK